MTTALYCLFVAALLPYVLAGGTKYFRVKQQGSVDNNQPRRQAEQLSGAGARIVAAQANAWEALVVFATAILVGSLAAVEAQTLQRASLLFISCRLLHPVFYLADMATLRSVVFTVGFGACLWIFIAALF